MRRHLYVSLFLACAGCAGTTPQQSTMPDPEHGKSLEDFARSIFTHMDSGDFAFVKQTACPDAVMFDTDENGAPVTAWGKPAVAQLIDKYAQGARQGGKMSSQISRIQCEANASTGFCAIEFDQSMTTNGQTMGPYKLRGTVTAMIYKDHWIWTSWHGSPREAMPAASAPVASAAAPAPAAEPAAAAAPAPAPAPAAAP
jgi:hypothetical protein